MHDCNYYECDTFEEDSAPDDPPVEADCLTRPAIHCKYVWVWKLVMQVREQ